ncbi:MULTISPECIES: hypothetical protein [Pseudoalteromonas]|uniref:Uncharacterized protein n=1 Tax=Pseudoalteromonas amylolytica TaxID=1859457 RepID=A0A1S1MVN2_9GAMM|nr:MULTISPECIES: hypothetical protein [Pseudoalteromonas]OHU87851.1 hypothetical protein BFC16_10590 [Pseudoalteromonas sp. JW3]OHU91291.1 hypothetical protein BET10_10710 [Pseudoalteromonas amylolytica]
MKKLLLCLFVSWLCVACSSDDSTTTPQPQVPDNNSDTPDPTPDPEPDPEPNPEPDPDPEPDPENPQLAVVFPAKFMTTSPFSRRAEGQQKAFGMYDTSISTVPSYFSATELIDAILKGDTSISDTFDVGAFYVTGHNASCFGPVVMYSGHPDAPSPSSASGSLPSGDLGLWLVSDDSGDACAVAQTNALLEGIESQTTMSLMTLASMVAVATADGSSLPAVGSTLDVTGLMNDAGITDVTFSNASIEQTTTQWLYQVELSYQVGSDVYAITLDMTHVPSADAEQYEGYLRYTVEGEVGVSGIEFPGMNCSQNERTLAGSIAYQRNGDNIVLQARSGTLCGHSVANVFNSNNIVDVDNIYNAVSNPDGWSENFSIYGADFDLTTLAGDYAHVWQAGAGDSHSRVFNIGFNDASLDNGESHFGYGTSIDDTDGTISGFICNWAGPGADHTLVSKTQRQFFEFDSTLNVYLGTDHRANIEYAPTVSCDYDGLGTFLFDIDASGTLGDTALEDSTLAFSNDLWTPTDSTMTVPEAIAARGLSVPVIPFGWPAEE